MTDTQFAPCGCKLIETYTSTGSYDISGILDKQITGSYKKACIFHDGKEKNNTFWLYRENYPVNELHSEINSIRKTIEQSQILLQQKTDKLNKLQEERKQFKNLSVAEIEKRLKKQEDIKQLELKYKELEIASNKMQIELNSTRESLKRKREE